MLIFYLKMIISLNIFQKKKLQQDKMIQETNEINLEEQELNTLDPHNPCIDKSEYYIYEKIISNNKINTKKKNYFH